MYGNGQHDALDQRRPGVEGGGCRLFHIVQPYAFALKVLRLILQVPHAVEVAHDDRKEHMPGYGGNGAHQSRGNTVLENVHDVFKRGEAERSEHTVDHAVEKAVEILVIRGDFPGEEPFEEFFRRGDDQKRLYKIIKAAAESG